MRFTEEAAAYFQVFSSPPPAEAIHLGSLIAAHGYIFPISDHVLTLKDDGTLYRFQVRWFLKIVYRWIRHDAVLPPWDANMLFEAHINTHTPTFVGMPYILWDANESNPS